MKKIFLTIGFLILGLFISKPVFAYNIGSSIINNGDNATYSNQKQYSIPAPTQVADLICLFSKRDWDFPSFINLDWGSNFTLMGTLDKYQVYKYASATAQTHNLIINWSTSPAYRNWYLNCHYLYGTGGGITSAGNVYSSSPTSTQQTGKDNIYYIVNYNTTTSPKLNSGANFFRQDNLVGDGIAWGIATSTASSNSTHTNSLNSSANQFAIQLGATNNSLPSIFSIDLLSSYSPYTIFSPTSTSPIYTATPNKIDIMGHCNPDTYVACGKFTGYETSTDWLSGDPIVKFKPTMDGESEMCSEGGTYTCTTEKAQLGDNTIDVYEMGIEEWNASDNVLSNTTVEFNFTGVPSPSPTSTAIYENLDSYNLACTAEQWADSNWWVQIKCLSARTFIDWGKAFSNLGTTIMNGMANLFSVIFPFNLFVNINNSWQEAQVVSLPSALSWIDNGGNLSASLPAVSGYVASSSLSVWGDDFSTSYSEGSTWFSRIKSLSFYVNYLLFGGLVFYVGLLIYHKINE